MLNHDVGTLAEQHLGSVGFLARIVPGIHPDDLHLEVRIDRLGAEHEGVDAHHHFRNREGDDVTSDTCLRHLSRDLAHHITALVEARVIGGDILGLLVAGGMFEIDLRIFLGDLDGRIHEAKGGGEHDLAAFAR